MDLASNPDLLTPSRLAVKSSRIFLDDELDPFSGVVLIVADKIEEIIPESYFTTEKLSEIKENFEFFDFEDSYIFPGLIDLNVHLNSNYDEKWCNIEEVTRMASQGGVTTVLDHPLMNQYSADFEEKDCIQKRIESMQGKLYVDCALLGYLGRHNYKSIIELYEECSIFGFKLHLSRPLIHDLPFMNKRYLKKIFNRIEKTPSLKGILLAFDCVFVSDRERFMCSPLRSNAKEKRLELSVQIEKFDKFAGGVHEVIPSSEEMSDETYPCDLELEQIFQEQEENCQSGDSPAGLDKLRIRANLIAKSQKENAIANLEKLQYNKQFVINELDYENENSEPKAELKKLVKSDSSENELRDQNLEMDSSEDDHENSTTTSRKINFSAPISKKSAPRLLFFQEEEEKNSFSGNPLKKSIREVYSKLSRDPEEEKEILPALPSKRQETEEKVLFKEEKERRLSELFVIPEWKVTDNSLRPINPRPSSLLARRTTVPNLSTANSKALNKMVSSELHTFQKDNAKDKIKEEANNRDYNIYLSHHSLSWESNGLKMIFKNFQYFKNVSLLFSNLSSMSLICTIKMLSSKLNPADGVKLYTEVCIPSLYFHNQMIKSGQTKFKSSPPIRIKEERDLMLHGLRIDNLIDAVSSFHMSCPPEYKRIDKGNFRRCFNGLSCVGYNLQVMWTKLYLREKRKLKKMKYEENGENLDPKHFEPVFKNMIRTLCVNPAKILKIESEKGRIKKGCQADLVVWKPFKIITVDQKSVSLTSPKLFLFNNKKLYGEVTHTFLAGRLVYKTGENLNQKRGRVLKRP